MRIKLSALKELLTNKFTSTYYSKSQAEKISEVLLYAEMSGKNTQGIVKLIGTEPMQKIKPKHEPKFVKETKLTALINGGGNAAPLVCQMATDIVIDKCRENGMAIVGTNNTFASSGAIGFYADRMAKEDLIGIVFAGSPGGVAPFGGIDPLFGTNPIAFGFPTESDPLIFDFATSAITWYGLVRAKALGQKLPEGVAVDSKGNLTSDPDKAMEGAILPFDKNYKGYGLSLMVEILTGPLVGGTFADLNGDWSNLFIAIDPDQLIGRKEFKVNCSKLIGIVKKSRKQKGFREILIPGEKGLRMRKGIENSGEIEIDDKLVEMLQ